MRLWIPYGPAISVLVCPRGAIQGIHGSILAGTRGNLGVRHWSKERRNYSKHTP